MNIVHEYHQMDAQTDSTFRSEKTPASDALMIRPMRREDIPLVAGIERQMHSLPWSGRAFSEALQRDYYLFLTAWHAGVLAGYCGFQRSFEIADITNVTVTDRYRRRGIGRRMLEVLMQTGFAQGVERFTLEVRSSNAPAIALYTSLGFRQEGIRRGYYESPKEDALILWTPEKRGNQI